MHDAANTRFVPDVPRIAHEQINGEVVILQFDTGTYFSMRESAAALWELLAHAGSTQTLLAWAGEAGADPAAVEAFLGEIAGAGLTRTEPASPPDRAAAELALKELGSARMPPSVERFTDLQDLLLADPIHEAAPAGWPHLPPADDRA
jgi:hypothetical protein